MPDNSPRESAARRIVVVGSGIAGAEAALTLAIGLPDADVTLVGRWPSIRLLPDLVYVPFDISSRRIDVPVEELVPHGVNSVVADVERVDTERKCVRSSAGEICYDVLVVAPGAAARAHDSHSLRTLDDALRVRDELATVLAAARDGHRRTIVIRAEAEDSWTAPACEMALLLGAWIRSLRLDDRVETLLATPEPDVFPWFGPVAETMVESALRRARVKVETGIPAGRLDQFGGDLVVEFGALQARTLEGLPGRGPGGWYETSPTFEVAPDTYVIGDATKLPYRAGFATAWQARRVLRALGGDPTRLGLLVDDIPSDAVEYQMDLADGVLRARLECADSLSHPFLGHDADVEVTPGSRPDKLVGLLLHDRVLRWHAAAHDAPLAYRDALSGREVA
jgi:hypothetical protein